MSRTVVEYGVRGRNQRFFGIRSRSTTWDDCGRWRTRRVSSALCARDSASAIKIVALLPIYWLRRLRSRQISPSRCRRWRSGPRSERSSRTPSVRRRSPTSCRSSRSSAAHRARLRARRGLRAALVTGRARGRPVRTRSDQARAPRARGRTGRPHAGRSRDPRGRWKAGDVGNESAELPR